MINTYAKSAGLLVSKNFKTNEFDCHCKGSCHTTKIDSALVEILQRIREHFGKAVIINSGYRCEKHNKAVGGASSSLHTKGKAADIVVKGINPAQVAAFAERIGVLGIGLYDNFVHIDTRTKKAFWYSHKQEYRSTFGGTNSYTYNGEVLRLGSRGEAVKWLQRELTLSGFACGKIDGIFGEKTKTAVKAFQKAQKIAVDGICGKVTAAKLKEC